jgi:hypothetical protein
LAVLPPHEIFALLHERNRHVESLVGDTGPAGLQEFWDAYVEDPSLAGHTALLNGAGGRHSNFSSRVPVVYHVDGAQASHLGVSLMTLLINIIGLGMPLESSGQPNPRLWVLGHGAGGVHPERFLCFT